MSVLRWLKPAMLAATVVAAGSLSAAAAAQQVTVLRGSPARPSPPYSSIDCNNPYYAQSCQDNQSAGYSPLGYDDYPDYWGDFPFGFGDGRGFHRGFRANFHRGGFRRGGFNHAGFHRGGFHSGGFHPGGFRAGGFHGGGGHR